MGIYFVVAAVAYLLGSIPFGYILVKVFKKQDIRATGSGNIGATNVARSGAKGLAVATLLLDGAKGAAAVIFCNLYWQPWSEPARLLTAAQSGSDLATLKYLPSAIAALSAIAGHMFPPWLRFRGGKGVATAVGAFLVLSPATVAISLAVFAVVVGATRYVSLGSIVGTVAFPVAFWWLHSMGTQRERLAMMPAIIAAAALIIAKHHANIRRLLAGTESKFGAKSS